jgi:recombinational DNA repair protein (RecF pathway)
MAGVVFAFGSRPSLDKHQALEVAALLALRRSVAAASAASKIRAHAERSTDRAEISENVVELTTDELSELISLVHRPEEMPPFAHLCDEAVASLSRG